MSRVLVASAGGHLSVYWFLPLAAFARLVHMLWVHQSGRQNSNPIILGNSWRISRDHFWRRPANFAQQSWGNSSWLIFYTALSKIHFMKSPSSFFLCHWLRLLNLLYRLQSFWEFQRSVLHVLIFALSKHARSFADCTFPTGVFFKGLVTMPLNHVSTQPANLFCLNYP